MGRNRRRDWRAWLTRKRAQLSGKQPAKGFRPQRFIGGDQEGKAILRMLHQSVDGQKG